LGRFAETEGAVADVPLSFSDSVTTQYLLRGAFLNCCGNSYPVQDREGVTGLDFVSSNDPRVLLTPHTNGEDSDTLYSPYKYDHGDDYSPPVVIASGIEARLIWAEGALHEHPTDGAWLDTLNALRRTVALSDTTDPGTTDGRVDLLFRERAFWLFATAHRLGDLRRLVARYERDQADVFPVGDNYGDVTTFPFDGNAEHIFNPKITGCTSQ
jgi:hypothetical protein